MTEQTPLDQAHTAMETDGGDAARLRFYERLLDGELFMLLTDEAKGDQINPQIFPVDESRYVLVFDRAERLSEFAEEISPYVAVSGRTLVSMIVGQGIGAGVNLGVAPSSILIPPEAIDWLASTMENRPTTAQDRPVSVLVPADIPEKLLLSLNEKLAMFEGLARFAYLVLVVYETGRKGHLLAFVDAPEGAQTALSEAVGEALVFSGIEAGELDVAFFAQHDPLCAKFAKVGLRFDLPQAQVAQKPQAPGMDPDNPPRLR